VTSRHNLWIAEFLPWFSCPDIFSVIPSATAPPSSVKNSRRLMQAVIRSLRPEG
jgi:hypothetical protein